MKNILLLFLLGATMATFSCNTDPCADKICEPNAICQDGTCECEMGYLRNGAGGCETVASLERDKFVKAWAVTENCSSGSFLFTGPIDKSLVKENELLLHNFYDVYDSVQAVMTSATTFEIPSQFHDGNRVSISGNGIYAAGSVTLDYSIEDLVNNTTNQCSSTYN